MGVIASGVVEKSKKREKVIIGSGNEFKRGGT